MQKNALDEHLRKEYIPNETFAVREGGNNGYVLVLKHQNTLIYYQIFKKNSRYHISQTGQPNFLTVKELVGAYSKRKLGLPCLLTFPYISARREIPQVSVLREKDMYEGKHFNIWEGRFAKEKDLTVTVAVKCISRDYKRARDNKNALYNEGCVLSYLQRLGGHIHILSMHGIWWWSEHCFLIQEFCREGNLLQYIGAHKADITSSHCVNYCTQIASAMAFLEKHQIVHRNLRGSNVLVDHSGQCKLSGFHCATTQAKAEDSYEGKLYSVLAAPRWTAPEVFKPQPIYTIKSDVWSFGLLTVQIYSLGEEPFASISDANVQQHIQEGHLPDIPITCQCCTSTIIGYCLNIRPEKRPSFFALEEQFRKIFY